MSSIISPAQINFTKANGLCIYRGSYWEVPVTIFSRTNLVDEPVDLSNYTGTCAIKRNTGDDTPLAMPEVVISDSTPNLFIVSLSSSLTQNIPTTGSTFDDYDTYYYEVTLTDKTSQESYRAIYGNVDVIPAVLDSDDNE